MAIKLNGSTSGSVALDAPADTSPSGTDVTLTLPTSAGSSGQYLQTNGSGALSWQTLSTGKILQVVQTVNTGVESRTSDTYADIPDMSATITPSSSSNKILVLADLSVAFQGAGYIRMFRGTTEIYSGDAATGKETVLFQNIGDTGTGNYYYGTTAISKTFLDSPATTGATTYKFQWRTHYVSNTIYLNRGVQDSPVYHGRTASSITLMEVAV